MPQASCLPAAKTSGDVPRVGGGSTQREVKIGARSSGALLRASVSSPPRVWVGADNERGLAIREVEHSGRS